MTTASSADNIRATLAHRSPGATPMDFGATFVTGIHVSCVAALRRQFGLGDAPVRVIDPGQMLGEVEGVFRRMTRYGFPLSEWKPWRMPDGLEVLVPGGFQVTYNGNGDVLIASPERLGSAAQRPHAGGWLFLRHHQPPGAD